MDKFINNYKNKFPLQHNLQMFRIKGFFEIDFVPYEDRFTKTKFDKSIDNLKEDLDKFETKHNKSKNPLVNYIKNLKG